MNKRNTDGYVLIYVLVVVAVMGLIATALMSSTLQVIQAQEKSVEYMKDKYEAQGTLEKDLAQLSRIEVSSTFSGTDSGTCAANALSQATANFSSAVESALNASAPLTKIESAGDGIGPNESIYEIAVYSSSDSIRIDSNVRLKVTTSSNTSSETPVDTDPYDNVSPTTTYTCTCTHTVTDVYVSDYSISSVDPTPEGGAET